MEIAVVRSGDSRPSLASCSAGRRTYLPTFLFGHSCAGRSHCRWPSRAGGQLRPSSAPPLGVVVSFRHLGGQSQYSVLAELQRLDGRFAEMLHHVRGIMSRRSAAGATCLTGRGAKMNKWLVRGAIELL